MQSCELPEKEQAKVSNYVRYGYAVRICQISSRTKHAIWLSANYF